MRTLLLLHLSFITLLLCKNVQGQSIPNYMFDLNYSNNYIFTNANNDKINYSNGDIILKLKNDFEVNAMGIFLRNFKSKHHRLYGGTGLNYSEYAVQRNIFKEQSYTGHFPSLYTYSPDRLNYTIQTFRFHLQLCHYTFYKRLILFQKIGLSYTSFIKKENTDAQYIEKYGNSYPTTDSAYITTSNPYGWHFVDSYTYTTKNDLDIYKNGFYAFYKFGVGIRVKQFTPFVAFEYSSVSTKIPGSFFKFQVGLNYSILPR